ncbi:MAG: hypothetical protein RR970_20860, partial [Hafnia sp.]
TLLRFFQSIKDQIIEINFHHSPAQVQRLTSSYYIAKMLLNSSDSCYLASNSIRGACLPANWPTVRNG